RSLRSMLLFLLLLRPPPTSTLFPYTTLFRSVEAAAAQPAVGFREQRAQRAQFGVALPELGAVALGRARDAVAHGEAVLFGHEALDRKSTRLNSSHVKISYAVFCLKKKNITAA